MLPSITDIIKAAIAFITNLRAHADDLAKQNADLTAQVADLNAKLVKTAATTADLTAARAAADKHAADSDEKAAALQATLDSLNDEQTALASAITDHPDVPLQVTPLLDVIPAPTEPAPVPPVTPEPAAPVPVPADTSNASLDKDTPAVITAPPEGVQMDPGSDTLTKAVAPPVDTAAALE